MSEIKKNDAERRSIVTQVGNSRVEVTPKKIIIQADSIMLPDSVNNL